MTSPFASTTNSGERGGGPAPERRAVPAAERPLVHREQDAQLLTARLVTMRRPGQWVSVAVVLVLFAKGVHTPPSDPAPGRKAGPGFGLASRHNPLCLAKYQVKQSR